MTDRPGAVDRASAFAGRALGALSAVATRVRDGKPLHPRGAVVEATVVRPGASLRALPWVDDAGTDRGIVRFSRAAGLPRPLPDVLGLALRLEAGGRRHDLLLATTGTRPVVRHLLRPRLDPLTATYTSLFPYAADGGLVMFAAAPAAPSPRQEGAAFRLLVAPLRGRWRPFATLHVAPLDSARDEDVAFDPVLNPLPGLQLPHALRLLREPAYSAARATRA